VDLKSKILKVVILLILSVSRIYAFDNLQTIYTLANSDECAVKENKDSDKPVLSDLLKQEQSEEDAHLDLPFTEDLVLGFTFRYILSDTVATVHRANPFILTRLFIFFDNLRI
jgi:hypothetical protein